VLAALDQDRVDGKMSRLPCRICWRIASLSDTDFARFALRSVAVTDPSTVVPSVSFRRTTSWGQKKPMPLNAIRKTRPATKMRHAASAPPVSQIHGSPSFQ
jgi:hypothetical protein